MEAAAVEIVDGWISETVGEGTGTAAMIMRGGSTTDVDVTGAAAVAAVVVTGEGAVAADAAVPADSRVVEGAGPRSAALLRVALTDCGVAETDTGGAAELFACEVLEGLSVSAATLTGTTIVVTVFDLVRSASIKISVEGFCFAAKVLAVARSASISRCSSASISAIRFNRTASISAICLRRSASSFSRAAFFTRSAAALASARMRRRSTRSAALRSVSSFAFRSASAFACAAAASSSLAFAEASAFALASALMRRRSFNSLSAFFNSLPARSFAARNSLSALSFRSNSSFASRSFVSATFWALNRFLSSVVRSSDDSAAVCVSDDVAAADGVTAAITVAVVPEPIAPTFGVALTPEVEAVTALMAPRVDTSARLTRRTYDERHPNGRVANEIRPDFVSTALTDELRNDSICCDAMEGDCSISGVVAADVEAV